MNMLDMRYGGRCMLRVFSKKGMYSCPKFREMFRVGPYVGLCVFNWMGIVIMKTK